MAREQTNGWRTGRDPAQRWLRIFSTLAILATILLVVIRGNIPATDLTALVFIGTILVLLLGYEGLVHLPVIRVSDSRSEEEKKEEEKTDE
jgi:hypothetical protein